MNIVSEPTTTTVNSISSLQGDAWEAWNASYHEPNSDSLRALGNALYHQDVLERITALFARSDEQNRWLDSADL